MLTGSQRKPTASQGRWRSLESWPNVIRMDRRKRTPGAPTNHMRSQHSTENTITRGDTTIPRNSLNIVRRLRPHLGMTKPHSWRMNSGKPEAARRGRPTKTGSVPQESCCPVLTGIEHGFARVFNPHRPDRVKYPGARSSTSASGRLMSCVARQAW